MIYSSEIQIPILCPIQFREPKEIAMYDRQYVYTPKINGYTLVNILISQAIHDAKSTQLYLKLYDKYDVLKETYLFTRLLLSTGYYYAAVNVTSTFEGFGYFQIEYGGNTLADSLCYEFNPTYEDDLKAILYTNSTNDWNTVFTNSYSSLELPVRAELNHLFTEAQATITETKITVVVKTSILANDFDVIITNGTQTLTKNVISTGDITYTIEVLKTEFDTIFNGVVRDIVFKIIGIDGTVSDENFDVYIGTSSFVFFNAKNFVIYIECGFVPRDFRGEQETEDYLDQSLTNETVYGNNYEVHPLTIGDNGGVPNWLAYKMMCATICDTFRIDDVDYERVNGSKFEKVEDTENGLAIYKVDLQTENTYLQ